MFFKQTSNIISPVKSFFSKLFISQSQLNKPLTLSYLCDGTRKFHKVSFRIPQPYLFITNRIKEKTIIKIMTNI